MGLTVKRQTVRVIFNSVSKVIRDCIGFALLHSVIDLEISLFFPNQSDAKLKSNRHLVTRVFPRIKPVTCVYCEFSLVPSDIYLSSDWPL